MLVRSAPRSPHARKRVTSLIGTGVLLAAALAGPVMTAGAAQAATGGGYGSISFTVDTDSGAPKVLPPEAQQNSAGAHNWATVKSASARSVDLVVTFPKIGGKGGVALANAQGLGESIVCAATSWWQSGTAEKVQVHCNQAPGWAWYDVAYTRQVAAGGSYAYALANRPAAASYTPSTSYQYATSGKPMTVTRQSAGRYTVRVPSVVTAGSTVAVGASGASGAVCRVASWAPTTGHAVSDQKVTVRCDAPWGAAKDSTFVLVYAQGSTILGAKALGGSWWVNANRPYAKDYFPPQVGIGSPALRMYREAPGDYYASYGYYVACSSSPTRGAATPFLLQGAGSFTYLTQVGSTANVCTQFYL